MMYIFHRFCKRLGQLDNVGSSSLKRSFDICLEPWQNMRVGATVVYEILPWIDMYFAELKFFHDVFERRQAACDMLRLVSKSFQEARSILFTIQADDKSFEH
jgi:hypothetical protein